MFRRLCPSFPHAGLAVIRLPQSAVAVPSGVHYCKPPCRSRTRVNSRRTRRTADAEVASSATPCPARQRHAAESRSLPDPHQLSCCLSRSLHLVCGEHLKSHFVNEYEMPLQEGATIPLLQDPERTHRIDCSMSALVPITDQGYRDSIR